MRLPPKSKDFGKISPNKIYDFVEADKKINKKETNDL